MNKSGKNQEIGQFFLLKTGYETFLILRGDGQYWEEPCNGSSVRIIMICAVEAAGLSKKAASCSLRQSGIYPAIYRTTHLPEMALTSDNYRLCPNPATLRLLRSIPTK